MKTLEQLALETVVPDGGKITEYQENEIAALVKFGKLVLENANLPTPPDPDVCLAGGKHDWRPLPDDNYLNYVCIKCKRPATTSRLRR